MTPQEEEEAALASANGQVAVSSMLTLMKLSFSTTSEGRRRAWSMSLRESTEGPEIPVVLVVDNAVFGVAAAISHGDLDPNELWWKLPSRIPFVRMERQPPRLLLVAQMPIDRYPPYLGPDTIQAALNAVFSAVMFLVKEYPEQVRPEPFAPATLAPAPQGNDAGGESP